MAGERPIVWKMLHRVKGDGRVDYLVIRKQGNHMDLICVALSFCRPSSAPLIRRVERIRGKTRLPVCRFVRSPSVTGGCFDGYDGRNEATVTGRPTVSAIDGWCPDPQGGIWFSVRLWWCESALCRSVMSTRPSPCRGCVLIVKLMIMMILVSSTGKSIPVHCVVMSTSTPSYLATDFAWMSTGGTDNCKSSAAGAGGDAGSADRTPDGKDCVDVDSYAIIPASTLFSHIVPTVLRKLGYSDDSIFNATGKWLQLLSSAVAFELE